MTPAAWSTGSAYPEWTAYAMVDVVSMHIIPMNCKVSMYEVSVYSTVMKVPMAVETIVAVMPMTIVAVMMMLMTIVAVMMMLMTIVAVMMMLMTIVAVMMMLMTIVASAICKC
jgi:hypothetical protein